MAKSKNNGKKGPAPAKQPSTMASRQVGANANPGGRTIVQRKAGPRVEGTSGGGVRVRNTERLTSLAGAANTDLKYWVPFNPGSTTYLTWLPNIARNYSYYRLHNLELTYVPFSATNVSGEVTLACTYDREDARIWYSGGTSIDLGQMAEYTSGPVYAGGAMVSSEAKVGGTGHFGLKVDTKDAHRRYPWFIVNPILSSGGASGDAEANLAEACHFLMTLVQSTTQTAGVTYLTYDIEFVKPCSPYVQV